MMDLNLCRKKESASRRWLLCLGAVEGEGAEVTLLLTSEAETRSNLKTS